MTMIAVIPTILRSLRRNPLHKLDAVSSSEKTKDPSAIFLQKGTILEWWLGLAVDTSWRSDQEESYVVKLTFEDGSFFKLGCEELFETEWCLSKHNSASSYYQLKPYEGGMLVEENIQVFHRDGIPHANNSAKFSKKIVKIELFERITK